MEIKQVAEGFAVSPQVSPEDVKALAEEGYRSLLCNRPDGEAPDQPTVAEIQAAAEQHGLAFRNVPVISGQLTPADIAAFSSALDEMDKPMVAYCRTGTRSIQLWALAEGIRGLPANEILAAGKLAGYDLEPVVNWLRENQ
ncbi:MAG: TIGR01244 family sulfur transferase [Pseudohongiellaceae bacterium]